MTDPRRRTEDDEPGQDFDASDFDLEEQERRQQLREDDAFPNFPT